jgi:hypothetical protein
VRGAGGRRERRMKVDPQIYSRHQVICAACAAWTEGGSACAATYFYDGISFWRRDESGWERVIPSWRSPEHGWRHDAGCACEFCEERRLAPIPGVSAG